MCSWLVESNALLKSMLSGGPCESDFLNIYTEAKWQSISLPLMNPFCSERTTYKLRSSHKSFSTPVSLFILSLSNVIGLSLSTTDWPESFGTQRYLYPHLGHRSCLFEKGCNGAQEAIHTEGDTKDVLSTCPDRHWRASHR